MAWNQSGNIRGASGVPGASGPPGATGPQGPAGPTGGTGASGGTGGTGGPGTTSWNDITDKPGAILNYKGTWNVSTNTPTLSDSTGSGGDVYRVSVGGSRNLGSGTISWEVGDYAIWSPVTSSWEKADTTDAVSSVAGRTGAVNLTSADLGASGSASSSTFLRGDNTWAVPSGITRSISTLTTSGTTIGSAANTDYVVFANITSSDPNYSKTVAILHGEGTNGSTTIVDNSAIATNWTPQGSASISTTQKKFGNASIYLPSGSYLSAPSSVSSSFAFGSGDFCIEMFIYITSFNADGAIYGGASLINHGSIVAPSIYIYPGPTLAYHISTNTTAIAATTNLSTNTWYHVAVARSGTSTKLFINGTQSGSTYTDTKVYTTESGYPKIGYWPATGTYAPGYYDEVRITKGAAVYTSNFTAPTAAFADSGAQITMPTAVSNTNRYTIRALSDVTVNTTSSQNINSATTYELAANAAIDLASNGTQWYTL